MAAKPSISLFDVFIGRGRTIRNPTGPPGTHWRDPNRPGPRQEAAAAPAGGDAPGSGGNGTPANNGSSNRSQRASANAGSTARNGDAPADAPQNGNAPQDAASAADATAENNNQTDTPNPNSNQNSNSNSKGSKGKNNNDSKGKKSKKNKKFPAQSFTEEQDVRLIRLVGEQKSWREIAKEFQKPQDLLRERYEKINLFKNKNKATSEKPPSPKPSPKDTHTHKHKHSRHTHSRHAPSVVTRVPSVASMAYTMPTMVSLTEDENFTYGEIAAISELIERDMGLIWDRISAGFYDMTGRRIAAEAIRGKFGVLGGEG